MLIGELSARSGVSARSLRYYEHLGLLEADRAANGYRDYPDVAVERAATIHALFGLGFPRDVVTSVLGCTGDAPVDAHDRLAARLEGVSEDLTRRIEEMTRTRDLVTAFLADRETGSRRA